MLFVKRSSPHHGHILSGGPPCHLSLELRRRLPAFGKRPAILCGSRSALPRGRRPAALLVGAPARHKRKPDRDRGDGKRAVNDRLGQTRPHTRPSSPLAASKCIRIGRHQPRYADCSGSRLLGRDCAWPVPVEVHGSANSAARPASLMTSDPHKPWTISASSRAIASATTATEKPRSTISCCPAEPPARSARNANNAMRSRGPGSHPKGLPVSVMVSAFLGLGQASAWSRMAGLRRCTMPGS